MCSNFHSIRASAENFSSSFIFCTLSPEIIKYNITLYADYVRNPARDTHLLAQIHLLKQYKDKHL